jgi:hypothetical protein
MRLTVILAALCAVLFASNADARSKHVVDVNNVIGCSDPVMRPCKSVVSKLERTRAMPGGLRRVMAEAAGRVVAHPSGCPARAFCGCGASVERFGRSIRSLWLAANWLKFPRASPAPGRAAVRRDGHHVVILRRHIRGSTWLVYDANSGRHRTRIHPRSLTGWAIVDPRGG